MYEVWEPLGYVDLAGGDWPVGHLVWSDHPIEKESLLGSWSAVPQQQYQPKA